MVWRDIEQDGDISTEVVHIIQLERTEFDDIVLMRIFCHLQSQRIADITCEAGIITRLLENMVDQ